MYDELKSGSNPNAKINLPRKIKKSKIVGLNPVMSTFHKTENEDSN